MAKILYNLASAISGRFGGWVGSRYKGQNVLRLYTKPTNPNTPQQQVVRQNFGYLSTLYTSLTPAQRNAWLDYGATIYSTDPFGTQRTLTAKSAFMRVNSQLLLAGESPLYSPPIQSMPLVSIVFAATADPAAGETGFTVSWSHTGDDTPVTGGWDRISISAPQTQPDFGSMGALTIIDDEQNPATEDYVFTGLEEDKYYWVYVQYFDSEGQSAFSNGTFINAQAVATPAA